MALWTTADRDTIKAAILTAIVEGVASVSIGGQSVQTYSLDQLRKMLEMIQADLATSGNSMGWKIRKLVPPGGG